MRRTIISIIDDLWLLSGNSIGRRLVLTSFGESHGKCIGAVLDGCPAGLELEEKDIQKMLDLRKPGQSLVSTQRKEGDIVEILTGTFRGYTTGAPITMVIWNKDQKSIAYEKLRTEMRPGHSDYPAYMKYKKFNDHRGGGRFSGRLTATHVMGGAIARKLLKDTIGVETNSYTTQIGKIKMKKAATKKEFRSIYTNEVRCPEKNTAQKMKSIILDARKKGDSLGGIIESITTNLPVGLGEPIFGSLLPNIVTLLSFKCLADLFISETSKHIWCMPPLGFFSKNFSIGELSPYGSINSIFVFSNSTKTTVTPCSL